MPEVIFEVVYIMPYAKNLSYWRTITSPRSVPGATLTNFYPLKSISPVAALLIYLASAASLLRASVPLTAVAKSVILKLLSETELSGATIEESGVAFE